MNPVDPGLDQTLREQLSAWMDGELPDEQARFLERRLEHDPQLRATWERWLYAASCLREPAAAPRIDVSAGVAAALANRAARPRPVAAWALAAAAVLALAVLLPAVWTGAPSAPGAPLPAASAQAVAVETRPAAPLVLYTPAPASPVPPAVAPMQADALVAKPWPRSPLAPDPALATLAASARGGSVPAQAAGRPAPAQQGEREPASGREPR